MNAPPFSTLLLFSLVSRDWRGFSYAHLLLASTGGDLGGDNGSGGGAPSVVGSGVGGTEAGDGGSKESGALLPGGGSAGVNGGDGGGGGDGAGGEAKKAPYKAGFLDDPALKVGRHRHMTRGDQHTGPVVRCFCRRFCCFCFCRCCCCFGVGVRWYLLLLLSLLLLLILPLSRPPPRLFTREPMLIPSGVDPQDVAPEKIPSSKPYVYTTSIHM